MPISEADWDLTSQILRPDYNMSWRAGSAMLANYRWEPTGECESAKRDATLDRECPDSEVIKRSVVIA
jgi:hypothetical protein